MINKSKIIKDAQKFVAKAQWDKAIAEYEKILAASPGDANTHNTVGDLYLKKNDLNKAVDSYKNAAEIFNKSGFALKAIALYKKVLNIKPDQIDTMLVMGKINAERGLLGNANENYLAAAAYFTRQGQKARAIDIYKTLCDLNPENLSLAQKLADLYLSEGFENEGVSKYIELAEMKLAQEDLALAHDFLEKVSHKGSDRFNFVRVSASLDLKSNRMPEAVNKLEELINTDPKDVRVMSLLAEAYLGSGLYEKSAGQYRKLLEVEPGNMLYRMRLVDAYLGSGDYDSAWKEDMALVEAHIARSEFEEAQKLLREFLAHRPESVEARQQLADIYSKTGHEEETAKLHLEMADLYFASGETAKAVNIYSELLAKNPDDEAVKARLSSVSAPAPEPEPAPLPEAPEESFAAAAVDEGPRPSETTPPAPPWLEESPTPVMEAAVETEPVEAKTETVADASSAGTFDLDEEEEYLPETGENVVELPETGPEELGDFDIFGAEGEEEPEPSVPPAAPVASEENLADRLAEIDVYIGYGLIDKAMTALSELEVLAGANPELMKRRIEVCKSLGDVDGFVDTTLELARMYEGMGQNAEAEKVIRKAREIDPGDDRLMAMLMELSPAELPKESGAHDDVFAQTEQAAAITPGSVIYLEELAEADFYAQQGLTEEAGLIYRHLLEANPDDPGLKSRYEALAGPMKEPAPSGVDEALDGDFFDLAAELQDELDEAEPLAPEPSETFNDKHLEEVFLEFKKGVEEQLGKEDYETHYNLGIAYKEMGMLDEALGEFVLASKDPSRVSDCTSMRGLCYLEKGDYDAAIREFKAGLDIEGREKGEYMGLKYDLATAYELKEDIASAQGIVNGLFKEDERFRDVKERLRRLNKALLEAGITPEPDKPDTPPKKSKVSYL